MIDVTYPSFGAVPDGQIVNGAVVGTNSTAAIAAAITAAGTKETLYFPDGGYIITPGALPEIRCSVYGPGAVALAERWDTDSHIFKVNYDETYPVPMGTGNTGLNAWKTFNFYQIIGSPDSIRTNIGVYCSHLNESRVRIGVIRGCSKGFWADGAANTSHIGTNDIELTHVYMCGVGVLLHAGFGGNFLEANRIKAQYMYGFGEAAISFAGGGSAGSFDNQIDVVSMGFGIPNGNGLLVDGYCARNEFKVRSWDGGPLGTGMAVYAADPSHDNVFRIPKTDPAHIIWEGANILDTVTGFTDGNSRSETIGSAPPAWGRWRTGDKCWNNAAVPGGCPGWIYASGRWVAMANLGN